MVLAGFVEFNVTYMLLSSASLLSRAFALGFGSIFALAIYKFGMIDAVGHLLIIAILFVLAVSWSHQRPQYPGARTEVLVLRGLFHDGQLHLLLCLGVPRLLLAALSDLWKLGTRPAAPQDRRHRVKL